MREVWPGKPFPRGATFDGRGVNFAVYSRVATRVEVCLYDPADPAREIDRFDLPEMHRLRLARLRPGARSRARSTACACTAPTTPRAGAPLQPEQAARRSVRQGALGRGRLEAAGRSATRRTTSAPTCSFDERDSAAGRAQGRGRRATPSTGATTARPTPLARARSSTRCTCTGFTKRHPEVPEELRGTYAGLAPPGRHRAPEERWASPPSSCCRCTSSPTTASCEDKRPAQLLGLQHARLLRARAALREPPHARGAGRRVQGDGQGAARRRDRGDPRRRLQPHLRGQPPRARR